MPLPGLPGYFMPFQFLGGSKNQASDFLTWDTKAVSTDQFLYIQTDPGNYASKTLPDFRVIQLDTCFTEDILKKFSGDSSSLLLWTNKKQQNGTKVLPEKFSLASSGLQHDVLLVYAESSPDSLLLRGNPSWYALLEYNIVGILPGKSKPGEVIIFSAHYDHEGVIKNKRDSILNGANDNASGTTALLALADYFSKRNNNERTIMFCAFAGEELGLLGSADFVTHINPGKIVAAINIEMIGLPQYGKNRVFITGERYSGLSSILRNGLKKNGITVRSDPDEAKQLFKRSDNYSFAVKGVPAHSIMGSDDSEPCYHKPCDELGRIDIPNMTRIIQAIAAAAEPLINGGKTPERTRPVSFE